MFTALAAFADAFGNPMAPAIVLALALLLTRPLQLRIAAVVLGCLSALPTLAITTSAAELALALLGGIVALLLYAELMLHLVLPGLRFAGRCVLAVGSLSLLAVRTVLGLPLPSGRHPSDAEPPRDRP